MSQVESTHSLKCNISVKFESTHIFIQPLESWVEWRKKISSLSKSELSWGFLKSNDESSRQLFLVLVEHNPGRLLLSLPECPCEQHGAQQERLDGALEGGRSAPCTGWLRRALWARPWTGGRASGYQAAPPCAPAWCPLQLVRAAACHGCLPSPKKHKRHKVNTFLLLSSGQCEISMRWHSQVNLKFDPRSRSRHLPMRLWGIGIVMLHTKRRALTKRAVWYHLQVLSTIMSWFIDKNNLWRHMTSDNLSRCPCQ